MPASHIRRLYGVGALRATPLYPVEIDWSHPLARGLMLAHVTGQGRGRVLGDQRIVCKLPNPLSTVTEGVGPLGAVTLGGNVSGNLAGGLYYDLAAVPAQGSADFTIFGLQSSPNAGALSSPLGGDNFHNARRNFQFRLNGGAPQYVAFNAANANPATAAGPVVNANQISAGFAMSARYRASDGRAEVDIEGRSTGSAIAAAAVTPFQGTNSIFAINSDESGSQAWGAGGGVYCGYIWLRRLSDAETLWIANEPYAFLAPMQRRMFLLPTVVVPPPAGAPRPRITMVA